MKNFKLIVILSLFISFTLTANAQGSFYKKELVNIGGQKISVADFMKVYNKNRGQDSISVQDYLDLYINFKLKVMEAESKKMDTARSFIRELRGYRKQLAKPYFVDEKVSNALVKEAYQRKLYDIRASHILIRLKPDASPDDTLKAWNKINKIRKEILNGKDFSKAAIAYSEDPSTQDRKAIPGKQRARHGNHGDLGYFSVFNMVYPFENAAYKTAVGKISPIVRTRFGYHLIKVTDKRPAMGMAQVAHIFVRLSPDASPADTTNGWQKINNIYKKIQGGMSFEEAARKYSEDKGSSNKGGKLPKFTSNRIVPEFIEQIDVLNPGQISKPFRTNYGYHIIKLISIKHPGTFEQEEQSLRDRMERSERAKKSKESVLAQIKKEHHLQIDEKALATLFSSIDSSFLKGKFVADSLIQMTQPVMWIGKKPNKTAFTQYDLARYLQQHQRQRKGLTTEQFLQKLFNQFVDKKCIAFENQHLEDFYPEFKDLMNEYHDGILLFNLMDKKVWSKAIEDSSGLKSFYQSHAQDYQWEERVEAEIFETQKQWMGQLIKMVEAAPDKKELARKIIAKKIRTIPVLKADTGIFQKEDKKVLGEIEWKKGLSKPLLSDVENKVSLIYIEKIVPPATKTFEEARGLVTARYQDYLEKQWIKQLKKKYPVLINQKVLNKLIKKTTS
jgi:peptidyl-prolyl cis-trans isomerase SurA